MTQVLSEEELDELANTLATGHALNMFALVPTIERLLATIDSLQSRLDAVTGPVSDRQLLNVARAIGATIKLDNHLDRAREVIKVLHMDGEYKKP